MTKINSSRALLGLSFFLLTIGNSEALTNLGINQVFTYLGFFLLTLRLLSHFFGYKNPSRKFELFLFILTSFLFNIGIVYQDLPASTKLRLVFTMLIIAEVALLSNGLFTSKEDFITVGKAILIAVVLATILSLVFGVSLTTLAVEGVGDSSQGFNGGLQHKNYFAVAMLASFMCFTFGADLDRKYLKTRWLITILLILSNSRGGYILFVAFFVVMNFNKLKLVRREQRALIILIAFIVVVSITALVYSDFVLKSSSYDIRIQGLMNYFQLYANDNFHLYLGNAEMAFRDSGLTYEENVRSILGWNGTTELSILSVLIKNGIVGLIGYLIIFTYRIKQAVSLIPSRFKLEMFATLIALLGSALLENYIVNIQIVFGIFCYVAIGSFPQMSRELTLDES